MPLALHLGSVVEALGCWAEVDDARGSEGDDESGILRLVPWWGDKEVIEVAGWSCQPEPSPVRGWAVVVVVSQL
jgi:hypothetical protein